MGFHPSQEDAINHGEGPCMVLAGPGSGKTTVLTQRILRLIEKGRALPAEILVITFTRAAAEEMEKRFLKLSGEKGAGVQFGTFHSIFFHMLKVAGRYSSEDILTERSKRVLLERVIIDTFPEVFPEPDLLTLLLGEFSKVKNSGEKPTGEILRAGKIPFDKAFEAYENAVRNSGKVDFDDMLIRTKEMLLEDPEILRFWQRKFKYIMIDEFQDINRIQYDMIRMLSRPRNNLFIVGDDDQSIYRFRGSRPEIMLGFPNDYPGTKVIRLIVNYRSEREIVKRSLRVIEKNSRRYRKKLTAASQKEGSVLVRTFETEDSEYAEIAEAVRQEILSGTPPEKIACLFRTKGAITLFAARLMGLGIPFCTREEIPNLFSHQALKPLYAFLNFMNGHPTRKNFLLFMNCPVRYLRRADLTEEFVDIRTLPDRFRHDEKRKWMGERVALFCHQLDFCRTFVTPYSLINYFRKALEYDRYIREQAIERRTDAAEILELLDEVQESAAPFRTVDEWYDRIALVSKELSEKKRTGPLKSGGVTVSTLHASKGLEWESVYMLNLSETIMPHERASTQEGIEEERRLFYVGMTRAVKNLHLCHAAERYGKKMEISRFVKETGL